MENQPPTSLSNNLKVLRQKSGFTQLQLAIACNINHKTYGSYEEGRAEPPITVLIILAKFYKLDTIEQLICGKKGMALTKEKEAFFNRYRKLSASRKKIVDYIIADKS